MRLELFDYPLPPERIAQIPMEPRDASRLLVLRSDGTREHRRFPDLLEYLHPGDLLVFNDTRVLPARLFGQKVNPGTEEGAQVEALLLQRIQPGRWEALAYPGRRLQVGAQIRFGTGELTAEVIARGEEGTRILEFRAADGSDTTDELIHRLGQVPLPPYIHERLEDAERYQTIYAREEGSAAAPTAGLHFTPRIFQALEERGVGLAFVTLHVGIATFRPVKTDTVEEHEMHSEWYSVSEEAARAINECKGRIIAVGTTTVRCLESAIRKDEAVSEPEHSPSLLRRGGRGERSLHPGSGLTRLYIRPGDPFYLVEGLLTNFHMPKSSLLILISAFAGLEPVRAAYQDALDHGYRFLSFGDAMFIERTGSISSE